MKVDMKYDSDCMPSCCGSNDYPCGFFLSHKQLEKLGLAGNDLKAGESMNAEITLKLTSVTVRDEDHSDGKKTECYAVITEMEVKGKSKKTATQALAENYEE